MNPTLPLDEDLVRRLPLPLAQLYRRAANTKTALEGHLAAFYLWEASLKLLASAAVVTYARQPGDPKLAELLQALARPSLGQWWEFSRTLVPVLAERGAAGYPGLRDALLGRSRDDLPRTAGLDAAVRELLGQPGGGRSTVKLAELFDHLVTYRNRKLGHGAIGQLSEDVHRRMASALLLGMGEMLARVDVLAGQRLLHVGEVRQVGGVWLVQRYELVGERPRRVAALELPRDAADRLPDGDRVYLEGAGREGELPELTLLHPLVALDVEAERVLFLNSRRGKRGTEYLCYTTGATVERPDAGGEQRELLARVLGMAVSEADAHEWQCRWEGEAREGEAPAEPAGEEVVGTRRIGEYELLSELGRGGMGVVYRAWQPSLGRQVALKRLLQAGDPKADARFRREIRALGRVDHPSVVKVHTSGADGEHFYYTMELVEGVPLSAVTETLAGSTGGATEVDLPAWRRALSSACSAARQAEKPLSDSTPVGGERESPVDDSQPGTHVPCSPVVGRDHVRQVAELVQQVAEAAHALHEAGIVHRDIKPGNILVGPDGTQAVLMDLGLAQLADDVEGRLTRTRQFVGTLRYASPEQVLAVGGLDRRSDVYSLGATLWELLTLRPLYGADEQTPTPELMRRIQYQEPERPRKYHPGVPRDLEAIVLKCLEKDPTRRYATAHELAEELGRFLRAEPVQARPVGQLERGWRWCKRNRAVASLLATVLLLLTTGVTVSTALFVKAEQRADEAEEERKNAETREIEAKEAKEKLAQSLDQLEESLARSLLRPIGLLGAAELSDPEIDALWEVASSSDEVCIRFVREAMRSHVTTEQLRNQGVYAVHAAAGLDARRRGRIEKILIDRLAATSLDTQRFALAETISHLGDIDPITTTNAAPILVKAMSKTKNPDMLRRLAQGLSEVAGRLEPRVAGGLCRQAATTLTEAMREPHGTGALVSLAFGLSAVAARLEPKEGVVTLTGVLRTTQDQSTLEVLANSLAALAARLEPKDGEAACWEAAVTLRWIQSGDNGPPVREPLANCLSAVAVRLQPREAALALTEALSWTRRDNFETRAWAKSLLAAAADLEPNEGTATLIKALLSTNSPVAANELADGLPTLAARLEPKEVAAFCRAAPVNFIDAMSVTNVNEKRQALAKGLSAVVRLQPKEAVLAFAKRLRQIDDSYLEGWATGLSAVQLEPREAVAIYRDTASRLTQAMSRTTEGRELRALAQGLSALARSLEPRVCREGAAILMKAMSGTTNSEALEALAKGLSALVARLEAKEAAVMCRDAAAVLIEAMSKTRHYVTLGELARGLSLVAVRLEPSDAKEFAVRLRKALSQSQDYFTLEAWAQGLSALGVRMEPKEAAVMGREAAATLTRAMSKSGSSFTRGFAEALSEVAELLERREASTVCGEAAATLTKAMSENRNSKVLAELVVGLPPLVGWMEPREAAAILSRAISKTEDLPALWALVVIQSWVAAGLEHREASVECGKAVTRLTQTLSKDGKSHLFLFELSRFSGVAARLEPKEAKEVAMTLTQAMSTTDDSSLREAFAHWLSMVAARLESKAAKEVAATLTQAMSKQQRIGLLGVDRSELSELEKALSGVLLGLDRSEQRQRTASVVLSLGAGTGIQPPVATIPPLQPALEPLPCRFSDQELVDMLKWPLTVGQARRVILDQLEIRHKRKFADHWDFVHFATERRLGLDFTSPPKRP